MDKIRQFGLKYGYRGTVCFSYILLAVISVIFIGKLHMPRYLDDEFSYWGIAASVAGYDWHDLLAYSSYYSFGYSILLLPLCILGRLGIAMPILYKLAIIMNGVLLLLCFKMTNYVARKMFPHLNRYYSLLICLGTTLYVNNVAQVYSAWTELCLYFMFWCVLVCLIKVLEEPRLRHILLLLLASAYIFAVHMRAIGVVIAVGLVLAVFILLNRRKISLKTVLITLAAAGILFLAVIFVKELLIHYIYANNSRVPVNDFSGQAAKVMRSTAGIASLFSYLLSILGKLYYLGVASWGFAFLALVVILFKVAEMAGRWIGNKKITLSSGDILFIFIGMAGMAQVCITALYKSFSYDFGRMADTICFGRYSDFIIGPLILVGLAVLPEISRYLKEILLSLLVLLASAITVQYLFAQGIAADPATPMVIRASSVTGMFYFFPEQIATDALLPAFIAAILFLIFVFVNLYEERNKNIIKRVRASVILLLLTCGVWCGFGLKYAWGAVETNHAALSMAELLSGIDRETDLYMVADNKSGYFEVERVQWLCPDLPIRIITTEEFTAKQFNTETVYLTRADDPTVMAQVSDHKKLVFDSGTICLYTEPGSKAEAKVNERLEAVYSDGDRLKAPVDLAVMMTDLSYQKYSGSLYYNFNGAGYITWNTGLKLPDGSYEFIIDMEVSGLADGGEIGYITVADAKGGNQASYPLTPQDFSAGDRQEIKVAARLEDYAEPLVGIYNAGNCSMKVNGVNYQQIGGNVVIEGEKAEDLREIGEIVTRLSNYKRMEVCYVDSDSSAIGGFPDFKAVENAFPAGITETLPGILVPDKDDIGNRYYLVENTDDNTVLFNLLDKGNIAVFKNKNFTLLIPDDSKMRETVAGQELAVLADGKGLMDVRFLYEAGKEAVRLGEMGRIPLPRGRYEVAVDFTAAVNSDIDIATIFLNGKEIPVTKEMLTENHYREVYELELTETSYDVRLGLFPAYPAELTGEKIEIRRLGNCYGYIQKIPVYDLQCENAVYYADRIKTGQSADSSVALRDFFLDYGEYQLTFTGQRTTGTESALIRIYRNGVIRTEEPLQFTGKGIKEFAFGMSEYEPAEWTFEITCPAGSGLELADFVIVR